MNSQHNETGAGRLVEVELRRVNIPLVTPFRTSFGVENERDVLLLRTTMLIDGVRVDGWGECVAMREPLYSAEFVDGAEMVITDHLLPRLWPVEQLTAAQVSALLEPVRGHPMAKGAVEMAILDAQLRATGQSLSNYLGGTRTKIASGVSVGIFDSIDVLCSEVQGYVDDGYQRIKLKIEPGWDIEPVRVIREMIGPDLPLQVDANTAYGRSDIAHLCRLDEFDLLLIEQPLPEEDLLGHAQLARASSTPVCLDESVVSMATAADAIELGATQIINIKPGRVGGYLEARRIHDLCVTREIPVWCGGMVETGIGRAANAGLASLPGFSLPGDVSASSRFYQHDIVTEPIVVIDGHVAVPQIPGLGFELDHAALDAFTTASTVLVPEHGSAERHSPGEPLDFAL